MNSPMFLRPDEAVQGADAVDLDRGGLLEQGLHLRAVFADDVAVIAAGLVHIVAEEVDLIGEQCAVDRAERAEGVGREQRARRQVIADHNLRPVDHRALRNVSGVVAGLEVSPSLDEVEGVLRGDADRGTAAAWARMRSLQTMTVSGWRSSTSLTVPEWSGSMWWMTR